ncbi:unnamed protein product, partial [Iphiclides podalirius]
MISVSETRRNIVELVVAIRERNMSLRNFRKLQVSNEQPNQDESSGDEYEPLYVKADRNVFADFSLSSNSESAEEKSESSDSECGAKAPRIKEKKKKARKNNKARRRATAYAADTEELDEIDQSVKEVNALLGTPPPASPVVVVEKKKEDIRKVDVQHLNVSVELMRMFGADPEDRGRGRGRVPNLRRIQRQVIIPNLSVTPVAGLSMVLMERTDDATYFSFRHSRHYREAHIEFLKATDHRFIDPMFLKLGEKYKHVEAQLEMADYIFLKEQYSLGGNMIEKIIYQMECAFHPLFHLGDMSTRLEYKYIENRAFYVAVLKYIHMLSNRACHRTALELAKMLMNLDPTDPLAVIFVIDVLAIRAREFEWLIKAIDFWRGERGAGDMFNMQYSYALAYYHLARQGKEGFEESKAEEMLQEAIMNFPVVAFNLVELASEGDAARISSHRLFEVSSPHGLGCAKRVKDLFSLYARLAKGRWRDTQPLQWLIKNLFDVVRKYDADPEMQERVDKLRKRNSSMIRCLPTQVQRHCCVIKTISELLVDGPVPSIQMTRLSDPIPMVRDTIDLPGYTKVSTNYKLHHFNR